ncbi:MAG: lytic transglycosylase domain-containing protein [Neisseriaceae bacterium]|nr:lytic transglycosylase domain-containing protein [Neisseriaceae bacterium]
MMTKTLISLLSLLWGSFSAANDADFLAARDAYARKDIKMLESIVANTSDRDLLGAYPSYWLALRGLSEAEDATTVAFLSRYTNGALTEKLVNEWIKVLGKKGDWATIGMALPRLSEEAMDVETRCYAQLYALKVSNAASSVDKSLLDMVKNVPAGCHAYVQQAAENQLLTQNEIASRIRLLKTYGYTTAAANLVNTLRWSTADYDASAENLVIELVKKGKKNHTEAFQSLLAIESRLTPEQRGFVYGQLAYAAALKMDAEMALAWYNQAQLKDLTPDQWDWWMRSALRLGDWKTIAKVGKWIPAVQDKRGAWVYWQGIAAKFLGNTAEANAYFSSITRNNTYYGLLAREALGQTLSLAAIQEANRQLMSHIKQEPAVARALALYQISENYGRSDVREDARREWRWAMRGRSDEDLIAAAQLADDVGFYDMSIYSADRTDKIHHFGLRFPLPHQQYLESYSALAGIDSAWAYGLIRQESRFVTLARSGVGASGLMQLMPATAREVATKVSLTSFNVNDVKTNIHLGTAYLGQMQRQLDNNEIMATAAYNAGASRARKWQSTSRLDGRIYTETIPFDETRDYVQKVMSNEAHYALLLGRRNVSLEQRMKAIPAR